MNYNSLFNKVYFSSSMRQRRRRTRASRRILIAASILILLPACSGGPDLLNSERIERRFGSYGVEVVEAGERRRVSSLYSIDDSGQTCRTFAIVDFNMPVDHRIASEHAAIIGGGSIGEVFRDSGWTIVKTTLDLDEVPAGDGAFDIAARMNIDSGAVVARQRYRFDVVKGGERIPYATISETHHPDYLRLPLLRAIYARR
jgi:hypothetical protein